MSVGTTPREHGVQFYNHEEELVDVAVPHLLDALQSGGTAVIAATRERIRLLEATLAASGVDLAAARHEGRLIKVDATAVAERLMVGGNPDRTVLDESVGAPVRRAVHSAPLAIYGEIVACLWEAGHVLAALDVEAWWNELRAEIPFALLCGYPAPAVAGAQHAEALDAVCRHHSRLIGLDRLEESAAPAPDREEWQRFPASQLSPGAARRFVADTLRSWGHADLVGDASLIVTELATNAVVHSGSDFNVRMSSRSGVVRISVEDGNPNSPTISDEPRADLLGLGLKLAAAMARRWGVHPTDEGKAVWADLGTVQAASVQQKASQSPD